jgi:DUF1680 family protein
MKTLLSALLVLTVLIPQIPAQDAKSPHPLTPIPIQQVQIEDEFWSPKLKVWREVTIPDCFAKFEKEGTLGNFDAVRDGGGEFHGQPWYDGLTYEMIRGCADFLASQKDPALEARLDSYIERIAAAAAKDPDGYLNTYTQLKEPTHRWGQNDGDDNRQHDIYNAGAMIEAGVHYYRATGKTRLLAVATKLANHMTDLMGPAPRKNIIPGHSLAEEALVKLYLLFREQPNLKTQMPVPVEEKRYLELVEFWLGNHGNHEGRRDFGPYGQDHKSVFEMETIEGHAVRATLLCTGLVAAYSVNGRAEYLTTARRLWDNMVLRRMYINGGLGAVAQIEGFSTDYDLPNNGYLETCAAIGAGFFHRNMNLALADARYTDELERVLYNGVLSGVSLKGDTYFYENPLEADSKRTRWAWHSCPCCPPMFVKIMGALPGYIYAQDPQAVYVNLFIGSEANLTVADTKVQIKQTTRYPWDGAVRFSIEPERETEFAINLRLPAWCEGPTVTINGETQKDCPTVRGYAQLQRKWKKGDVIELSLPMPVQRIKANPKVTADLARVALQRGPLVYCLEGPDNPSGVRNLFLPSETPLKAEAKSNLLGGITVIQGKAQAVRKTEWPDTLYRPANQASPLKEVEFTAIPYYANANREPGDLQVWIAETPDMVTP